MRGRWRRGICTQAFAIAWIAGQGAQAQPSAGFSNHPVSVTGGAVDVNGLDNIAVTGASAKISVSSDSTIINWNSFDIAHGETLAFDHGGSLASFRVLNRVTGAGATNLAGTMDGSGLGSLWVINENGINISGRVQNVTGFVASTLPVANFDDPSQTYAFSGGRTNAISIRGAINSSGPILVVAPAIDMAGTVTTMGDAGFVVAQAATVALNDHSILNVRVDAGTKIDGAILGVSGQVTGDKVYAVAASDIAVKAALLNINGDLTATRAVATDAGIVLSSGGDVAASGRLTSSASVNVSAAGSAALGTTQAGGAVILTAGQDILASNVQAGRVFVGSAGGDLTVGSLTAGGGASVSAHGTAKLTGDVTLTGGNSFVQGTSIAAGTAGQTHSQTSSGLLTLAAGVGGVHTAGDLTLRSGGVLQLAAPVSGAGNLTLVSDAANVTASDVAVSGNFAIRAGADATAGRVTSGGDFSVTAGRDVAIDAISAGATSAVTAGRTARLAGNVTAGKDDLIQASSVILGTVGTSHAHGAGGAITITTGTLDMADGLTLHSGGGLRLESASDSKATSALTLISDSGDIDAGRLTTGGDLTVNAGGAVRLTGDVAAGGNEMVRGTNVALGSAGSTHTHSAGGALTITATVGGIEVTDKLVLQSDNVLQLTAPLGVTSTGRLDLVSSLGGISVGNVTTTGALTLTADQNVVAGSLNSGGDAILTAGGDATLGSAVAVGDVLVTAKAVPLRPQGTVTVAGDVAAGGNYIVEGGIAALGSSGLHTQTAHGVLYANGREIATDGNLVLRAGEALEMNGRDFVRGNGNLTLISDRTDVFLTGGVNLAGDLSVSAARTVMLGDTSPGALSKVQTGGGVTVSAGQSAMVGAVQAGGNVAVDAGQYALLQTANGMFQSGGNLAVSSGDFAIIAGNVDAGGNYTVRGARVELASNGPGHLQKAGGAISLDSISGSIRVDTALALQSGGRLQISSDLVGVNDLSFTSTGGDLAIRNASTTGTLTAMAARDAAAMLASNGDLTVAASRDISGSFGSNGAISVTAGRDMMIPDLNSGLSANLSGGGNMTVTTARSGGDIRITAGSMASVLGDVSAGGGYFVRGANVALGTPAETHTQSATGDIAVTSAGGIDLVGDLTLRAGGMLTLSAPLGVTADADASLISDRADIVLPTLISAGNVKGTAARDITISAVMINGNLNLNAGRDAALGPVAGGGDIDVFSGRNAALAAIAASGAVHLNAGGGALLTGEITAGSALGIVANGISIPADQTLRSGDTLTLDTVNGTSASGTLFLISDAADIIADTVTAVRSLTLTAARDASAAELRAGGALTITARRNAVLGSMVAGDDFSLTAAANAQLTGDAVIGGDAQVLGASVTLGMAGLTHTQRAGGGVAITATGGDLIALGNVALISNDDGVGAEGLRLAGAGAISRTGRLDLATGQDNTTALAGDILISGATVSVDDAIAGGRVDANGAATAKSGQVLANATDASGALGDLTIAGNMAAAQGYHVFGKLVTLGQNGIASRQHAANIAITAQDVAIFSQLVSDTTVDLTVAGSGTAPVAIGGADAQPGRFALGNAEQNRITAPQIEILAGSRPVELGDAVIPAATRAFAVQTSGDIRVTGAVRSDRNTLIVGAGLDGVGHANAIEVITGPVSAGSLRAATINLRAQTIAVGATDFLAAIRGQGRSRIFSDFLTRTDSRFYVPSAPNAAYPAAITAQNLDMTVGQWALVQNSGPATDPGGGIDVGALRLSGLVAGDPLPAIGIFGRIADQSGSRAALAVAIEDLGGIEPTNIRVNGCVVLSSSNCILTSVNTTVINVGDPGRAILQTNLPSLAVPVNLVAGMSNEALWQSGEALQTIEPAAGDDDEREKEKQKQKSKQKKSGSGEREARR